MPPVRTMPTILKPVKTERTHEENQERAYIAASRRSDRSLEARVESARRASEIHKRRTGRSLRVTEQDVVNEEMYEEEDDDLPMQYRRLTAHLNTNSSDFNRRLAAYLSNHVAMRTALDQAISSSYNHQNSSQPLSPASQKLPHAWTPGQNPQYPSRLSQHMASRTPSGAFRTSPYPPAGSEGHRPSHSQSPVDVKQEQAESPARYSSSAARTETRSDGDKEASSETRSRSPPYPSYFPSWSDPERNPISPLTTALPRETQMFFEAGFGNNDAYGNNVFENNKGQPSFAYDQSSLNKTKISLPYLDGMSQTLAPGVLDNDESSDWPASRSKQDTAYHAGPGFSYGAESDFNADPFSKAAFPTDQSYLSGQLTPADNEWSSFIDTNSWDDQET